ncbi:MAG: hypothetical protein WBQ50_18395 [Nocardioides sp.]
MGIAFDEATTGLRDQVARTVRGDGTSPFRRSRLSTKVQVIR